MGFYIPDYEIDLKQHLNLSNSAWLIIYEDMQDFYISEDKYTFSGFLNRVFFNYHQLAEASISQRYVNKQEELENIFSSREFSGMKKNVTETYVSALLAVYEKQLVEKSISYPKGEGKKFRLNKQNVEILRDSEEADYYQDTIGLYLKAIFEEYAQKPKHERERIFFNETADLIDTAIQRQKKLKLSIMQKTAVDSNCLYSRKFYLTPYKILQDKTGMFNYVIGYAEEIKEDGTLIENKIASFRISRIAKISLMSSMSGFLSKASKEQIEKNLVAKEPQFIVGDIMEIKIRFTKKGLENFNRQLYMKPRIYEKSAPDTYVFHCTEMQAQNYFFKFGNEIEVLSPSSVREKFINRYLTAYKAYHPED